MRVDKRTSTALGTLAAGLVLALLSWALASNGDGSSEPPGSGGSSASSTSAGSGQISPPDLPVQARQTLALIDAGGPFPYDRDGVVFGNHEGLLPQEPGGYYHEYTVPTPGESDRGARRIIVGSHEEYYYTADHYGSFRRIDRS